MISPLPKDTLIKIIPKQKGAGPAVKANTFLVLAVLVFTGCLIIFAVLYLQLKTLEAQNKDLDDSIARIESKENIALKNKLKDLNVRISDFAKLLQGHKYYSQFFNFLRGACHSKVQMTSLMFDGKSNLFKMNGITDDFKSLGEQLLILKEKPAVLTIRLDSVSFDVNKRINFSLSLMLNDVPFIYQSLLAQESEGLEFLPPNSENFIENSTSSLQ